jgi:hypothetical protein
MDEQFRILGRERQADLAREAQRFALADQVPRERPVGPPWFARRMASMMPSRGRGTHSGKPLSPHLLTDRTQELAGSSPASPIEEACC